MQTPQEPSAVLESKKVREALAAEFPPGVEKFRVGPVSKKSEPHRTKPLAYIDSRDVFDRLDAVVPGRWGFTLRQISTGVWVCALSVDGVTREGVGMAGADEGEKEKSGSSDAIKRAGVAFGIGRYLYEIDMGWVAMVKDYKGEWALDENYMRPRATAKADAKPTKPEKAAEPPRAPDPDPSETKAPDGSGDEKGEGWTPAPGVDPEAVSLPAPEAPAPADVKDGVTLNLKRLAADMKTLGVTAAEAMGVAAHAFPKLDAPVKSTSLNAQQLVAMINTHLPAYVASREAARGKGKKG